MAEYFIEREKQGSRAVLVLVSFPHSLPEERLLEEFSSLVAAVGATVLGDVATKRAKPDSKYFIGKGKAEELAEAVKQSDADLIIVNHDMTPSQERNLEQLCCCRVLDRSTLILDIFAQRARSFEGKCQVELAQLQHLRTRLIRGWSHLERQKGGIGLRGPGETQLETDRRLLGIRIQSIKKKLVKIGKTRAENRKARQRRGAPVVSLVGYTNAGKSTLFNALTNADAFVADQLFATLDATLRRIALPNMGPVILADTVGFINELPQALISAFRSTLEETRQSDLLLHVVDISDPHWRDRIDEVNCVLADIDAHEIPQLLVFNKVDRTGGHAGKIAVNDAGKPIKVWLSAATNSGCDALLTALSECLTASWVVEEWVLQPAEGAMLARLYDLEAILGQESLDDGRIKVRFCVRPSDYDRLLVERGKT